MVPRSGGGARGGVSQRIAGVGYDDFGHVINTGTTQLDMHGKALQKYKQGQNGYHIQYGVGNNKYTVFTDAFGGGGQRFTFTSPNAANDFIKQVKKAGHPWSGIGGPGSDKFLV